MTGIDEIELAVKVDDSEKHRGVAGEFHMLAQKLIDVIDNQRRLDADAHPR